MQIPETTRALLAPFIVLAFVGLVIPPLLVTAVVIGTHWFSSVAPDWSLTILNLLRSVTGVGSQMFVILAAGLPALAAAVCFTSGKSRSLSRAGKVSLIIILLGIVDALVISLFLDPATQGRHMLGGAENIKLMQNSALSSLKACFTYLMLLAGLKLEVKA